MGDEETIQLASYFILYGKRICDEMAQFYPFQGKSKLIR